MGLSDIKEKMHSGEIYFPNDDELMEEQLGYINRLYDFNMTRPTEMEKRERLLKEMFAEIGEGCYVESPLHSNFGGYHVHFGKNVYANFNLTLVDDTHIYVGDYTMFGPNVLRQQDIRFVLSFGRRDCSIICRCISEKTAGLGPMP